MDSVTHTSCGRRRGRGIRGNIIKSEPCTVVLIACCGKKQPARSKARDLYRSVWFRKARQLAESMECRWSGEAPRWGIMSALHGYVENDWDIDPYDVKLTDLRKDERIAWGRRVAGVAETLAHSCGHIVLLGGDEYCKHVIAGLTELRDGTVPDPIGKRRSGDITWDRPLQGLGIGEQLAAMTPGSARYLGPSLEAMRQAKADLADAAPSKDATRSTVTQHSLW